MLAAKYVRMKITPAIRRLLKESNADVKLPPRDSHIEADFLNAWAHVTKGAAGYPEPVSEHEFAAPERKWRFDFSWPATLVAVECEGGLWTRGRHQRPAGFQADAEKYNAAAERGWSVLRYTADDLRKRPVQVVEQVIRCLNGRTATNHA